MSVDAAEWAQREYALVYLISLQLLYVIFEKVTYNIHNYVHDKNDAQNTACRGTSSLTLSRLLINFCTYLPPAVFLSVIYAGFDFFSLFMCGLFSCFENASSRLLSGHAISWMLMLRIAGRNKHFVLFILACYSIYDDVEHCLKVWFHMLEWPHKRLSISLKRIMVLAHVLTIKL